MADANYEHEPVYSDDALPIGTTLSGDQFTITEHLGAGGFGITYRAKDNVLGRTIVIKECFPVDICTRAGNLAVARSKAYAEPKQSIVRMFMREARSLAKLRHRNIVGVHRAFEENETAYMALDLIDGLDLFDILEASDTKLSPARVRDILLQLLNAIEEVHDIGLLHRDISPDNILIEKTGTPVLIDFGAARADSSRHTRAASSILVVKDGYSPQEFYVPGSEQAPCSDLYALAATFYHVLSGEPPVNSQTRMLEIVGGRPDPCTPLVGRIQGYDLPFLQAIDQAMQIHPGDRLQSAAKWRSMIASSESGATPQAQTEGGSLATGIPLNLELSLARLVEETNDEVRRTSRILTDPEPVVLPVQETAKPGWVEDFNEDAVPDLEEDAFATAFFEAEFEAGDDQDDTEAPAEDDRGDTETWAEDDLDDPEAQAEEPAHGPPHLETNWVDRAKRKQVRKRIQSEGHFETAESVGAEAEGATEFDDPALGTFDWDEDPSQQDATWHSKTKMVGFCLCLFLSVVVVASFEGSGSSRDEKPKVVAPKVNGFEMNGSLIP